MTLMDHSRHLEKPSMAQKTYEGWVVENNDPDKRQRVRIRIPILHRDIPDDKLPWANINGGGSHANAGVGVGSVNVPDKGAKMQLNFEEDDPHNPKYQSSPASDDVNGDNELLNEDYPSTMGHVDSFGNKWATNKATGDVTFIHKSGATIHVDGAGNINMASPADINIGAKGDVNIAAQGKLNLHASGDTNIVGARVDLNSNGPASPSVPGARSTPAIADKSNMTSF